MPNIGFSLDNLKAFKKTKSQNVIYEMIETEKSYIDDMSDVANGYAKFFDQFEKGSIFNVLKICIDDLVEFSQILLVDLKKAGDNLEAISNIFITKHTAFYSLYGEYCDIYPLAAAMLENMESESQYGILIKECKFQIHHALPICCYLLKPVQRVMKYFLLLSSMESDKTLDTETKQFIKASAEKMKFVAESINERKRVQEGYAQISVLNSKILNLKDSLSSKDVGPVILQDNFKVNGKQRYIVLFEKALFIMTPYDECYYLINTAVAISKISLLEKIDKGNLTSFEVTDEGKEKCSYSLTPNTPQIKDKWILHIRRLILNNFGLNLDNKKVCLILGDSDENKMEKIVSTRKMINVEQLLEKNKNSGSNFSLFRRNSKIDSEKAYKNNSNENFELIRRKLKLFDLKAIVKLEEKKPSMSTLSLNPSEISMNEKSISKSSTAGSQILETEKNIETTSIRKVSEIITEINATTTNNVTNENKKNIYGHRFVEAPVSPSNTANSADLGEQNNINCNEATKEVNIKCDQEKNIKISNTEDSDIIEQPKDKTTSVAKVIKMFQQISASKNTSNLLSTSISSNPSSVESVPSENQNSFKQSSISILQTMQLLLSRVKKPLKESNSLIKDNSSISESEATIHQSSIPCTAEKSESNPVDDAIKLPENVKFHQGRKFSLISKRGRVAKAIENLQKDFNSSQSNNEKTKLKLKIGKQEFTLDELVTTASDSDSEKKEL